MTLYEDSTSAATCDLSHAVDILAFIEAQEIPAAYFDTPYYLAPAPGGEKDYALLRDTLRRTSRIGIAYVVIQARQHLAALIPQGQSLVLNTLRWDAETRRTGHEIKLNELHANERMIGDTADVAPGARQEAAQAPENRLAAHTANIAHAAGPAYGLQSGLAKPLQSVRVTGCGEFDSDDGDEIYFDDMFECDDVLAAVLRQRLHAPVPHASRGTAPRLAPNRATARRLVRRA